MISENEVRALLDERNQKRLETSLNIKIRNGQTTMGIRAALKYVLGVNE